MSSRTGLARTAAMLAIAAATCSVPLRAQEIQSTADQTSDTDALLGTIVVTATKKAGGTNVQDAPVAISAFGEDQIRAMQIKDVSQIAFRAPNVSMDDVGTSKGTANFSIRGLGVNSSIPSIDPTVGTFVDGMYLGVNSGVLFDAFDLQSVEVLRGPQGVLFGRNVTGGAVLINTTDPSSTLKYDFKGSATSGLRGTGGDYTASGVVRGPLIEDVLSAKVAVYYNNDDGWFKRTLGTATSTFGKSETYILRGALKFTPGNNATLLVKYEHGKSDGDGPAAQSHINGSGVPGAYGSFGRDTFDFSIDERGFYHSKWDQVIGQFDLDVGKGKITNIAGYRSFKQLQKSDIDSSPMDLFHGNLDVKQHQFSDELRYNGRVTDFLDLTTGLFYFTQKIYYNESRRLLGGRRNQFGGGFQDQETVGAFVNGDFDVTDALTVSAGVRWSHESKDVKIASLTRNVNRPCNVLDETCPYDFTGSFSNSTWSPRLSLQYSISPSARTYATYSRSYRAGGFNFRNTAADTVNFGPGPFGDEKVNSWEVGLKTEPFGRARLNFAAFYMTIGDMQREVNLSDPVAGVVQVIKNTADARIAGFEADLTMPLADGVVLDGSLGYTDGKYTKVIFDLNGDGTINARDKDLDIPRLAPFTASIGLTAERDLPVLGNTTARIAFSHRDASPFTDNNLGLLNTLNRLDASLAVRVLDGHGTITVYGQNLTNNVQFGGDTQLPTVLGPFPLGGTFSPLSKGRVFGIELRLTN